MTEQERKALSDLRVASAILAGALNELQLPNTVPGVGIVHLAEQAAVGLRSLSESAAEAAGDKHTCVGLGSAWAPSILLEHAADLAEKEFRSLPPVDAEGNGAEDAELAFRTMAFMRDLARVLEDGGR